VRGSSALLGDAFVRSVAGSMGRTAGRCAIEAFETVSAMRGVPRTTVETLFVLGGAETCTESVASIWTVGLRTSLTV